MGLLEVIEESPIGQAGEAIGGAANDAWEWGKDQVEGAVDALGPQEAQTQMTEQQLGRTREVTDQQAALAGAANTRDTQAPQVGVNVARGGATGWQPSALGGTGGTTVTPQGSALAAPVSQPAAPTQAPALAVTPTPVRPNVLPAQTPDRGLPQAPGVATLPPLSKDASLTLMEGATHAYGGEPSLVDPRLFAPPAPSAANNPTGTVQGIAQPPGTTLDRPVVRPTGGAASGYTADGSPARLHSQPGVTPLQATATYTPPQPSPGIGAIMSGIGQGGGAGGMAQGGAAASPGGVGFDATQTDETRNAQIAGANLAFDAALGQGPSAAAIQSRLDMDRATRLAQAQGAAQQGRSVGGALTAAMDAGARARADIGAQAMAQRAQEMATARGQAIGAAGQIRGQDTEVATEIARLQLLASQGNQDAIVRLQQIDDQYALGRGDQLLTSLGMEQRAATDIDAIRSGQYAADRAFTGGLIQTGGELLGALAAG